MSDYSGNFEKMNLSAAKNKAKEIGFDKVSNADIFEIIEERDKKEAKNKPSCVYIGDDTDINVPNDFEKNELVNTLYKLVNSKKKDIVGAYILHTNMKTKGKTLKFNDNGEPIDKDNYLEFDVYDVLAESFVLLETTPKRFISIPVCMAFKPLIENFAYADISVEKFKDFIDYLADENDDLEMDDEQAISKIIGGDIVSVVIDNSEGETVQINTTQPELDYDVMKVTFIVNIKEKKRNTEIVVPNFPWALE